MDKNRHHIFRLMLERGGILSLPHVVILFLLVVAIHPCASISKIKRENDKEILVINNDLMKLVNNHSGRYLDHSHDYETSISQRSLVDVSMETYLHAIRDEILVSPEFLQADLNEQQTHIDRTFVGGYYRHLTKDLPILVLYLQLKESSIGNAVGHYLANAACADLAGLHTIYLDFEELKHLTHLHANPRNQYHSHHHRGFFEKLPTVRVNKNPAADIEAGIKSYKDICSPIFGTVWPWYKTSMNYEFKKMIPFWREMLVPAVAQGLLDYGPMNTTLIVGQHQEKVIDLPDLKTTLPLEQLNSLPKYPDVVIHYRCSDNIAFQGMGLLPFHHIIKLIPSDARYVFITSDYNSFARDRMDHELVWNLRTCGEIEFALQDEILKKRPNSTVVLRRGGRLFQVLSMFVNSKTVICSASTFCFHFALANQQGKVFLPRTPMFYGEPGYHNMTCCGENPNIFSIEDGYPIWDWRFPNGTVADGHDASILIDILKNETYPYIQNFILP